MSVYLQWIYFLTFPLAWQMNPLSAVSVSCIQSTTWQVAYHFNKIACHYLLVEMVEMIRCSCHNSRRPRQLLNNKQMQT